jgi:hypothetical protein
VIVELLVELKAVLLVSSGFCVAAPDNSWKVIAANELDEKLTSIDVMLPGLLA